MSPLEQDSCDWNLSPITCSEWLWAFVLLSVPQFPLLLNVVIAISLVNNIQKQQSIIIPRSNSTDREVAHRQAQVRTLCTLQNHWGPPRALYWSKFTIVTMKTKTCFKYVLIHLETTITNPLPDNINTIFLLKITVFSKVQKSEKSDVGFTFCKPLHWMSTLIKEAGILYPLFYSICCNVLLWTQSVHETQPLAGMWAGKGEPCGHLKGFQGPPVVLKTPWELQK